MLFLTGSKASYRRAIKQELNLVIPCLSIYYRRTMDENHPMPMMLNERSKDNPMSTASFEKWMRIKAFATGALPVVITFSFFLSELRWAGFPISTDPKDVFKFSGATCTTRQIAIETSNYLLPANGVAIRFPRLLWKTRGQTCGSSTRPATNARNGGLIFTDGSHFTTSTSLICPRLYCKPSNTHLCNIHSRRM